MLFGSQATKMFLPTSDIDMVISFKKKEQKPKVNDSAPTTKSTGGATTTREQAATMVELFQDDELVGYLKQNLAESTKSPFDHVIYDSAIEKDITADFEISEEVKVYAKLPSWFKIDTPLGTYNPDWAVLWDDGDSKKLYFVIETKGALSWEFLRPIEKGKIECGKKHFEALGNNISLEVANSYESFVDIATGKS